VLCVGVLTAGSAEAQFGGLGDLLGRAAEVLPGGEGDDVGVIVDTYVVAAQSVLVAQAGMLQAFGLGDEAAQARLEAENLTEGATRDALEGAAQLQTENSRILQEAMEAEGAALGSDARLAYAESLGFLGLGVAAYAELIPTVRDFRPGLNSIGGAAGAALYIVRSLPGNGAALRDTLTSAIQYATRESIEVPEEATAALSALFNN